MDIYKVLSSVPHNPHYLKRYIKFINWCKVNNRLVHDVYYEQHHICPKSKIDMFPQYKSFKDHPWNRVYLTERQHVFAHNLLHRTFGGSQTLAYVMMSRRFKADKRAREKQTLVNSLLFTGPNNPNYGNRWSAEQRQKASLRETGKKLSDATRLKQAISRRRHLSEHGISADTIRKCSETKIGKLNPNYGKPETSSRLNNDRRTCSICGAETNKGNWARWHEEKCKHRRPTKD